MLIKNLTGHLDNLHDGRPIPAYGVGEITEEDLALPHYQTRIAEGRAAVSPEGEIPQAVDPSGNGEKVTTEQDTPKAPRRKRAPKGANEEKN